MARRFKPEKREILPDARFNNLHLQMMINRLMYSCLLYTSDAADE